MSPLPRTALIIVAAGDGARAARHHGDIPKQYRLIAGKPLLTRAIEQVLALECIETIVPVIHKNHRSYYEALKLDHPKLQPPVIGAQDRQNSCLAGLEALADQTLERVLIHDAARPFISPKTLENILNTLASHDGALPVVPVTDTIKRSIDGTKILATEDRSQLWAAQTPQGFHFDKILAAHRAAHRKTAGQPTPFTDDAAIAEWAGLDVVLVKGSDQAFKITRPEDFARAETLLGNMKTDQAQQMETRVGTGLDIHPFEPGNNIRLGGVDFAHSAKLKGHSDADAALHVLTDALLGALAQGDIGTHFPPSEKKWKNTDSEVFLSFAAEQVRARDGRIVHLDLTIVCEAPKIGPKSKQVQSKIAKICQISSTRVSVKATTSEKMGFIGREEGLMTLATATIEIPRGGN